MRNVILRKYQYRWHGIIIMASSAQEMEEMEESLSEMLLFKERLSLLEEKTTMVSEIDSDGIYILHNEFINY